MYYEDFDRQSWWRVAPDRDIELTLRVGTPQEAVDYIMSTHGFMFVIDEDARKVLASVKSATEPVTVNLYFRGYSDQWRAFFHSVGEGNIEDIRLIPKRDKGTCGPASPGPLLFDGLSKIPCSDEKRRSK